MTFMTLMRRRWNRLKTNDFFFAIYDVAYIWLVFVGVLKWLP